MNRRRKAWGFGAHSPLRVENASTTAKQPAKATANGRKKILHQLVQDPLQRGATGKKVEPNVDMGSGETPPPSAVDSDINFVPNTTNVNTLAGWAYV